MVQMTPPGRAYGFFNCRADRAVIESELPTICSLAQIPSALELTLIEGMDNLRGDSMLTDLATQAKAAGRRYVLQAVYPRATNRETGDHVAAILNQAYQSPLYNQGEHFYGEVVFEEGGQFVFME